MRRSRDFSTLSYEKKNLNLRKTHHWLCNTWNLYLKYIAKISEYGSPIRELIRESRVLTLLPRFTQKYGTELVKLGLIYLSEHVIYWYQFDPSHLKSDSVILINNFRFFPRLRVVKLHDAWHNNIRHRVRCFWCWCHQCCTLKNR